MYRIALTSTYHNTANLAGALPSSFSWLLLARPSYPGGADPDMTVDTCRRWAQQNGFSVFALQFGGFCFGGNNIDSAMRLGASTGCNMSCTGASSSICGGYHANSLYTLKTGGCTIDAHNQVQQWYVW